jgi:DNA-binding PadR family transcriptional regulator
MSPVFRHGRLRLYLLKLLDESPRHGYEVIRLLQDRFMGVYAPSPGTIYPRLARLEEEGLVTHDETDGKKVYRITDKGREELHARLDDIAELEEEITASVRDIAREVTEDVRDTVRSLREELTWAAREFHDRARQQASEEADRQRDESRRGRDRARDQAHRQRDQTRDQAHRARDEARSEQDRAWDEASRARDEARRARDETRERGAARDTGDEERGQREGEGAGQDRWHGRDRWREHAGRHWGDKDWGDWPGWPGWEGWQGTAGPHGCPDPRAYRDLERLARQFSRDLRHAAWQAQAVSEDAVHDLRGILEDTIDRIRAEVFKAAAAPHHPGQPTGDPGQPTGDPGDTPGAPPPPETPAG